MNTPHKPRSSGFLALAGGWRAWQAAGLPVER